MVIVSERKKIPPYLWMAGEATEVTRAALSFVFHEDNSITISWLDRDNAWFSQPYDVAVRPMSSASEWNACTQVKSSSCSFSPPPGAAFRKCGVYEASVWRSGSPGLKGRLWKRFVVWPKDDKDENELLCAGGAFVEPTTSSLHWNSFMTGYDIVHPLDHLDGGSFASLEGGGALSQMRPLSSRSKPSVLRLTVMARSPPPIPMAATRVHVPPAFECAPSPKDRSAWVRISFHSSDGHWINPTSLEVQSASSWRPVSQTVEVPSSATAVRLSVISSPLAPLWISSVSMRRQNTDSQLATSSSNVPLFKVRTLRSAREVQPYDVSICTHLPVNRLSFLLRMVRLWKGHVEAAVWITSPSDVAAVHRAQKSSRALKRWVRFHLVEREGSSPYHARMMGMYPSAALRNVALSNCRSRFALETDCDALPSTGLKVQLEHVAPHVYGRWSVLAIPTFAWHQADDPPETKSALVEAVDEGLASAEAGFSFGRWANNVKGTMFNSQWTPRAFLMDATQAPPWDERFVQGDAYEHAVRRKQLQSKLFDMTPLEDGFMIKPTKEDSKSKQPATSPIHTCDLYMSFLESLRVDQ